MLYRIILNQKYYITHFPIYNSLSEPYGFAGEQYKIFTLKEARNYVRKHGLKIKIIHNYALNIIESK